SPRRWPPQGKSFHSTVTTFPNAEQRTDFVSGICSISIVARVLLCSRSARGGERASHGPLATHRFCARGHPPPLSGPASRTRSETLDALGASHEQEREEEARDYGPGGIDQDGGAG